jgi:hypothetical protein
VDPLALQDAVGEYEPEIEPDEEEIERLLQIQADPFFQIDTSYFERLERLIRGE